MHVLLLHASGVRGCARVVTLLRIQYSIRCTVIVIVVVATCRRVLLLAETVAKVILVRCAERCEIRCRVNLVQQAIELMVPLCSVDQHGQSFHFPIPSQSLCLLRIEMLVLIFLIILALEENVWHLLLGRRSRSFGQQLVDRIICVGR